MCVYEQTVKEPSRFSFGTSSLKYILLTTDTVPRIAPTRVSQRIHKYFCSRIRGTARKPRGSAGPKLPRNMQKWHEYAILTLWGPRFLYGCWPISCTEYPLHSRTVAHNQRVDLKLYYTSFRCFTPSQHTHRQASSKMRHSRTEGLVPLTPAPKEIYNYRVWLLAIIASMGAILFGYDLAFIGTTITLKSFKTYVSSIQ